MGYTLRVLGALVAGMVLGMTAAATGAPWLTRAARWIEPVGVLFVNAIRVAVVPLVVASLVVAIAEQRDARQTGRLGTRALAIILVCLSAAALLAMLAGYPLLARIHVDPQIAATVAKGNTATAQASPGAPSFAQWLTDLVPANVFKAAVDGALLPLVVVAVAFGLALTQVLPERRAAVVAPLRGVSDALLVYIGYVIGWAPLGVFALSMPLAARLGWTAAAALAYYIVVLSVISATFILLLYAATIAVAGVPLRNLAQALLPAQAVAFSSRSSMAALPATYEAARELKIPDDVYGTFLPLAAAIFRVGAVIAQVVGVLFLARLYDVSLTPAELLAVGMTVIATSLTVPGIPAGAIIVLIPVLAAARVPPEGIGILLAVDSVPDMFRTTANVTGWVGAAAVLGRWKDSTENAEVAEKSL